MSSDRHQKKYYELVSKVDELVRRYGYNPTDLLDRMIAALPQADDSRLQQQQPQQDLSSRSPLDDLSDIFDEQDFTLPPGPRRRNRFGGDQ